MATPSGLPSWSRTATAETYGGSIEKQNYQSQGVTNAMTDLGAEEFSRMAADLSSCIRTAPFASLVVNGVTEEVLNIQTQYGSLNEVYDGYNPPFGFPTFIRNNDGYYTLEFPESATDDFGVVYPIDLRGIIATDATSASLISITQVDPRTFLINSVDLSLQGIDHTLMLQVY